VWTKGLFIIRAKRELKRVYRNGCRYNERLNAEKEDLKRLAYTGLWTAGENVEVSQKLWTMARGIDRAFAPYYKPAGPYEAVFVPYYKTAGPYEAVYYHAHNKMVDDHRRLQLPYFTAHLADETGRAVQSSPVIGRSETAEAAAAMVFARWREDYPNVSLPNGRVGTALNGAKYLLTREEQDNLALAPPKIMMPVLQAFLGRIKPYTCSRCSLMALMRQNLEASETHPDSSARSLQCAEGTLLCGVVDTVPRPGYVKSCQSAYAERQPDTIPN
jgi:hypothetical protein